MKGGRWRRRRAKKKFSSKGISWVFRVDFQALSQVKRDAAGRLSGCQSNCCLMWHSWEGNMGREACGCFSWPLCDEKARNKRRNFVFIVADPQTIIYCDCQWDGSRKRQTIVRGWGGAWVASWPLYNWCVRLEVGYVFLCRSCCVSSLTQWMRQMNVPRRVLHAFRRCCKAKAKHDKCSHSSPASLSSLSPCPLPVPCCVEGCVLPRLLAAERAPCSTLLLMRL